MFHALATMIDKITWDGILEQIPEGKELIQSVNPDHSFVHISWIVSSDIQRNPLIHSIEQIIGNLEVFEIRNGGLGIFPGEEPVLSLVLPRSPMMGELQQRLWKVCSPLMEKVSPFYSPELWIPHITLMHQSNHKKEYCSFIENCINRQVTFSIKINNLALIYKDETSSGVYERFEFNIKGNRIY